MRMLTLQVEAGSSVHQIYQPQQFRLSQTEDREALELLRREPGIQVRDTILAQVRDLVRTRCPDRKLSATDLDALAAEHLGGAPGEEYGIWFYYPWSKQLVHLLDQSEFIELRTNRNLYKINHEERRRLAEKRVGIVGLSVGQSVALTLALERSCGELRLADFDILDLSNLNRVRAGVHNIGVPKVYVTAREIAEIDPYLSVTCFPTGVTEESCDDFLALAAPLDLVVEECDSIDIKFMVRERARSHRIPVVMDTCDRGMIDIERFDLEPERPIFHGLADGLVGGSLRGLTTEEKIPYVLAILGVDRLSPRLRASLIEVEQTVTTWPQLASGVAMGGGAAADVVRRILLGERVASGRHYLDMDQLVPATKSDLQDGEKRIFRSRELALERMLDATRPLTPQPSRKFVCPSSDSIRRLVSDAILAPSGGNCQPWKWLFDGEQLYVFHDRSRSRMPYDPRGFGSVLAIGCSVENLLLSANASGLNVECDLLPRADAPELIARFGFPENSDGADIAWRLELYEFISTRRTNRALGSRQALHPGDKEALTAAVRSVPEIAVHWLEQEEELQECADLLGRTDALQLTSRPLHQFLVSEIRWTPEEAHTTGDGITLESLELSPSDRAGFELCRDWSALEIVRQVGSCRNLEKSSRKAIASGSAVGVITVPQRTLEAYLHSGRAVERMWLTSTEHGLALHPMTSLPYLLAHFEDGYGLGFDETTRELCRNLLPRYRQLFPNPEKRAHVFLFRVSYAEETTWRSLRRPVESVLTMPTV